MCDKYWEENKQLLNCYAGLEVHYNDWNNPSYSTYENKEEILNSIKSVIKFKNIYNIKAIYIKKYNTLENSIDSIEVDLNTTEFIYVVKPKQYSYES